MKVFKGYKNLVLYVNSKTIKNKMSRDLMSLATQMVLGAVIWDIVEDLVSKGIEYGQ
jgi:hypothetical protein